LYATNSSNSIGPIESIISGQTLGITGGTGLSYTTAQSVIIANSPSSYITGFVDTNGYDPATGQFTILVDTVVGTGTYSNWDINLNGAAGGDGSSGTSGSSGETGATGATGPSPSVFLNNVLIETSPTGYNFTGTGVTVSSVDGYVTIDITGGSGGSTIEFEANSGLQWVGETGITAGTIYNTTVADAIQMTKEVGGLPIGTTAGSLKDYNLIELLDRILFPTAYPTYIVPTISVSSSVTGIIEVGAPLGNPNISVSAFKKDAGDFTSLTSLKKVNNGTYNTLGTTSSPTVTTESSLPSEFGFADPNSPDKQFAFVTPDSGATMPAPVSGQTSSAVYYKGRGNYDAGLPKKDSTGTNDSRTPAVRQTDRPQLGGNNFESSEVSLTGYYPYFWGWVDDTDATPSAVQIQTAINNNTSVFPGGNILSNVANGAGQISMAFNVTSKKLWFAFDANYPAKTYWGEQGNNLNGGRIGINTNPPDFFGAPTSLPCDSVNGYWSNINYNIYIQAAGTLTSITVMKVSPTVIT
jgi:hypothetical protein